MLVRLRSFVRRMVDGARAAPRRLRAPHVALLAAACLLIAGMYCTNSDMGGDPRSPRGDGRYRPVLARGDGHLLYLMARSTVLDGDWRFDNDLARFGDPFRQRTTAAGRKGIPHPIGPALVWAPLLAVAHAGAAVVNLFGAGIAMHGYTAWHQRIVFALSVVLACGAVLLGYRVAARWVGGRWGPTYAAVAVLLGTSLTYYATYMPSYGHAMDAFFSAAFLGAWALTLGRSDLRRFAVLGALLGAAALIRTQELALGVVLVVEIAARLIDAARAAPGARLAAAAGWIGRGAVALAVALVVLVPQLIEWQIVFGSWRGLPQGPGFTRWGDPLVAETLFSSRNGWLSTTPIAYAGVVGLGFLPRRARLIAAGFLAAVALQVYLDSIIFDWWAGASFGQRRLCNMTLPVVVGLAALLAAAARRAARTRAPRPVWHALAAIGLGLPVAYNLSRVEALRAGKPANSTPHPMCCAELPAPLRGAAQPIYGAIGNPFALPASAAFAWRHGVPLSRWDVAVGDYVMVPTLDEVTDDIYRRQKVSWNLGGGGGRYLLGGLGAAQPASPPYRWTLAPRAVALVPLLMPDDQRFALRLHPGGSRHVTVRWNDTVVVDTDLADGWSRLGFDVRDPDVGTNVLTIEAAPAPLPPGAGLAAPAGVAVGVAVGALEISYLDPEPAVARP